MPAHERDVGHADKAEERFEQAFVEHQRRLTGIVGSARRGCDDDAAAAGQPLDTGHLDVFLAEYADRRAHGIQESDQVQNFRTHVGIPNPRDAPREAAGDDGVFGGAGRSHRQVDFRPDQPPRRFRA